MTICEKNCFVGWSGVFFSQENFLRLQKNQLFKILKIWMDVKFENVEGTIANGATFLISIFL
jgi:hypothetical protein